MSEVSAPPTTVKDAPSHHPEPGTARWKRPLREVLVVVIAAGVGFASSYLHPGPPGPRGRPGPRGLPGPQGERGPAGSDAEVENLGVCVAVTSWTPGSGLATSLVSDVSVFSPTVSAEGAVSCPVGRFVSVKPQKQ